MLRKMACAFVILATFVLAAYAYEIRISRLETWEVAFEARPPRVVEILEGKDLVEYTFVVYQVKNETSQEIDLFPSFQVEADGEKLYTAGIYPSAEKYVKKRFGEDILGFADIMGIIKPGETKRGVAAFKDVDPAADKLTLYVSGLSGDFKKSETEEGKLVTMYRTYKVIYDRPGDEWSVFIDPVTLESAEWIWRE